jgi:lipoprotein-anchoring transpeptidase ErfK/SrfK
MLVVALVAYGLGIFDEVDAAAIVGRITGQIRILRPSPVPLTSALGAGRSPPSEERTYLSHAAHYGPSPHWRHLGAAKLGRSQQKLSADAINSAEPSGKVALKSKPLLARAEILLDQHHFSPGEIDGSEGDNFKKALAEFQRVNKLKPTGKLDQETWSLLTRNGNAPAVVDYTVRDEDVKGPFVRKIPKKMEDQADLEALGYRSPLELLAEKFHMSESLLKALNPGKSFDTAGTVLAVPNLGAPEAKGPKVAKIEIDKRSHQLRALDEDGNLIAFYPASVGSKEKPAPSGKSEVTKIARNPTYTYNPKYAFKEVHSDKKFTIKPGPNNPV